MNSNSNNTTVVSSGGGGGVGFAGLLTILFIALKLTGVIAWSWLWVLSPLWISFLIGVSIVVLCLVVAIVVVSIRQFLSR